MTLQTFVTLLVIGGITGLVAALIGKSKRPAVLINLAVAVAGTFLGYFVFNLINRAALQIVFALGGALFLLWLVRLSRK